MPSKAAPMRCYRGWVLAGKTLLRRSALQQEILHKVKRGSTEKKKTAATFMQNARCRMQDAVAVAKARSYNALMSVFDRGWTELLYAAGWRSIPSASCTTRPVPQQPARCAQHPWLQPFLIVQAAQPTHCDTADIKRSAAWASPAARLASIASSEQQQ